MGKGVMGAAVVGFLVGEFDGFDVTGISDGLNVGIEVIGEEDGESVGKSVIGGSVGGLLEAIGLPPLSNANSSSPPTSFGDNDGCLDGLGDLGFVDTGTTMVVEFH